MADEFEISDEEKLRIAQHFLLSTPPGQFNEVLSDVRKIVAAELLTDPVASGIARVSNTRSGRVVLAPTGRKVIVASASEIDAVHYVDPVDQVAFALDHLTLVTTDDGTSVEVDASLEPLRATLQNSATRYLKTTYVAEASAAGVYSKDGKLTMLITGEKINLKNFWSGKWISTWNVQVSGSSAVLSGEIKIHVHYFEDGNLQMQTTKQVADTNFEFSSEAEFAEKIFQVVKAKENELQSGLEEMYSNMNNETFKSLRRVMGITKTKMDWNVNAVRMVKQVRK